MVNVMQELIQQSSNSESDDKLWAVHVEQINGELIVYGN